MKIYLLLQAERGSATQKAYAFFFKRSAMAAAKRVLSNGGAWESKEDHGTDAVAFWITPALWMSVVPLALLFRDWSLKQWIRKRFHWQNLNDKKDGTQGPGWIHGRAWFHRKWNEARDGYGKRNRQVCFSWNFDPRWWLGFSIGLFDGDSQRDAQLRLHFGLAHFWITLENLLPKKYSYSRHSWAHETGITYFEDHFQIGLHHAGNDCRDCAGWKGWEWSCFVSDLVWGRSKYSEAVLQEQMASVSMPESDYPVKVKIVEAVWTRPRKPWPFKMRRALIECERGIPTPGKGENSWDCGQDATFGLTCPASTVEEALQALKVSVTRDRERYGGKNWRPEGVAA
jgi:hypothetical protein